LLKIFQLNHWTIIKQKDLFFYLKNLTTDITDFLNSLNESDNYWVSFSFYPDIIGYQIDEGIKLFISDPILINRESSALLLTQFIMNRLNIMVDFYYLDDSIISSNDSIIIVKFTDIEIQLLYTFS